MLVAIELAIGNFFTKIGQCIEKAINFIGYSLGSAIIIIFFLYMLRFLVHFLIY